jgi:MFS family permease
MVVVPLNISYRWRLMMTEWLFDVAGPLHIGGAAIILPFAQAEFGVSKGVIVWMMVGFSIATATFVLPAAYLGNSLGRRKLVILGSSLDMLSQLGIFVVPSIAWLIPIRMLGGIGNAFILANLPPMVVSAFPLRTRGRTLGIMGLGIGIGILVTAPLAGLMADTLGWRYLYLMTASMYGILFLAAIFIVQDPRELRTQDVSVTSFDYPGMVMVGAILFSLSLSMQRFGSISSLGLAIALLGVAMVVTVAFVRWELMYSRPLIDPRLFKNVTLSRAVLRATIVNTFRSSGRFLVPFFLIQGLGWRGAFAGSVMISENISQPFVSPLGGYLVDRVGTTSPILVAIGLMAAGGISMITLGNDPSVTHISLSLILMGTGWSLFMTPNRHDIYSSVPQDKLSLAQAVSGLTGHGTNAVGAAFGATLLGIFINDGIISAFQSSFIVIVIGFVIGHIAIGLTFKPRG